MKRRVCAALLGLSLLLCAACQAQPPAGTPTPTLEAAATPTPTPAPTPAPTPTPILSVHTDWSALTPYEPPEPICTRRYEEFTGALIPADDYGPLVPFLGDKMGGVENLYGLMTAEGEIVVDPVFREVWPATVSSQRPFPFYMLLLPNKGWAMAARDGSWCTEFRYGMELETSYLGGSGGVCSQEGIFLRDGSDLVFLEGTSGKELLRITDIPEEEFGMAHFSAEWSGGRAIVEIENHTYLYQTDGSREMLPDGGVEEWKAAHDWGEEWTEPEWCCDLVTGESYDVEYVNGERPKVLVYSQEGELIYTYRLMQGEFPDLVDGLLYYETNWESALVNRAGEKIFSYPLPVGEWD